MKKPFLSVLGTIAFDSIITDCGEKTSIGGSAIYSSLASALLLDTGIVSAVGKDFAKESLDLLERNRVNIAGVKILDGPTFRWKARYHDCMNLRDTIHTDIGVFKDFIPEIPNDFLLSDCLVLSASDPKIQNSFIAQFKCPKLIIGDTIDYYISKKPNQVLSVFKQCNIIVINEEEALRITSKPNTRAAAEILLSLGPEAVIIKQGKNGATLYLESIIKHIPAFQSIETIDPTGAGDSFIGAFAAYLTNKWPLLDTDFIEAIVFANSVASFVVENIGTKGFAKLEFFGLSERCQEISESINLPMPQFNFNYSNGKTFSKPEVAFGNKTIESCFFQSNFQFPHSEISKDIDMILWSMKLSSIRRYFHQRFFESETIEAEYASRIEPHPRLETVSEHSWHVADIVLLLGPRFPGLDIYRCVSLAILHDKLEISIGDIAPIGRDGTGNKTHAFDLSYKKEKESKEIQAEKAYLDKLSENAHIIQKILFDELRELNTKEALFVKAIDKLQALAYVYVKKKGRFKDKHLRFTLQYTEKCIKLFPPLTVHYEDLKQRLFTSVSNERKLSLDRIVNMFESRQLNLF